MALRRRAARDVDLFEDCGGRADRQPGAAVFLRDQRREIPAFGEIAHHFGWVGRALFQVAPVRAWILRADFSHCLAQLGIVLAELERDRLAFNRTLDVHYAALRA